MKTINRLFSTAFIGAIAALPVQANEKLATDNGCMACHKIDTKVVGPSFKEIAAKYKGDAGAEAAMIDKVKKGGSGTFGAVPMPPNSPRVSDADIETLVKWILAM
ncbi:MAG: c-type cytochrome [Methylococcaceae bacterium]|nr:c-type cytochrome [Methylococcaceae bacterium]